MGDRVRKPLFHFFSATNCWKKNAWLIGPYCLRRIGDCLINQYTFLSEQRKCFIQAYTSPRSPRIKHSCHQSKSLLIWANKKSGGLGGSCFFFFFKHFFWSVRGPGYKYSVMIYLFLIKIDPENLRVWGSRLPLRSALGSYPNSPAACTTPEDAHCVSEPHPTLILSLANWN